MEKDTLNITYAKNLEKQNFSSSFNLKIDSQVNVKTILNTSCFIFDERFDCANGKAVVNGKIGVKVLYVDTDNITNTITDTQPFSHNILDNSITADCIIMLNNITSICLTNSNDTSLKIDCNVSFVPSVYVNLALPNNLELDENVICKNYNFNTYKITNKIDTKFDYSSTLETKNNIKKILYSNSKFNLTEVTAQDGFIVVEGKLFTNIIYETEENEEIKIKMLDDIFNIKTDVEIANLKQSNILDLNLSVDSFNETITTELEDDNNIITINNIISIKGLVFEEVGVDCVEDLYSVKNEIEPVKSNREFICLTSKTCLTENIAGEISLDKDEPAIEEIIANININTELTNTYIKNGTVYFEGLINSTVIYLDEAKEIKNKIVEIPFVVNTKIEAETLPIHHLHLTVNSNKFKVRRGTIIELEYDINACVCLYKTETREMIDTITIGKEFDFSKYDYQIYIAKQNETVWDLCKRVKCYPEDLNKCNKEIPSTFAGGEKVIIKR